MYHIATLIDGEFHFLCLWKDEYLWTREALDDNVLCFATIQAANVEIWNLRKDDPDFRGAPLFTVGEHEHIAKEAA